MEKKGYQKLQKVRSPTHGASCWQKGTYYYFNLKRSKNQGKNSYLSR
jgi:hypothetical protein